MPLTPKTSSRKDHEDVMSCLRRHVDASEHSPEPRHIRLREAILDMIAQGYWNPGDKLPPEKEFALVSGLSLGTAQKTLTHLAQDGILARRHGHGTFVAGDFSQNKHLLHFRFIADDGTALMPVYAETIDRRVIKKRGPWSDYLVGTTSFIRVRRRINVGEEFDCISEIYVSADEFGALLDMPIQDLHRVVIRNLLATKFNAPTFSVAQRVYASRFENPIATLLKLEPSEAFGLILEVFSSTHHQKPLAFHNVFVPPNVRRLEVPNVRHPR